MSWTAEHTEKLGWVVYHPASRTVLTIDRTGAWSVIRQRDASGPAIRPRDAARAAGPVWARGEAPGRPHSASRAHFLHAVAGELNRRVTA